MAQVGGLSLLTTPSYDLVLVAHSNGTSINCTMAVAMNWVNMPPVLYVGPTRNVSEVRTSSTILFEYNSRNFFLHEQYQAALVGAYVNGPSVHAIDPDTTHELT